MAPLGIDELVGLETAVWQALVDGDPEADARLLSDDFLGVYPTGFADRDDHAGQLDGGPTVAEFQLTDARRLDLSDSAVLLSYRATYRRARAAAAPEVMWVSSLWCHRSDGWINVFSQDTPLGSMSPP